MLETVRRFWEECAARERRPHEKPEHTVGGDETQIPQSRPPRTEFAFTSTDVGNYA